MSTWRQVALEKLPEYRSMINEADNPMALWIELHFKFEEIYRLKVPDTDLIKRFYDYARWCLQPPGSDEYPSDESTAVSCAFYEHLPKNKLIRQDLPRWLTREEFMRLGGVFRYHLTEEEYENLKIEFLGAVKKASRRGK